MQEEALGHGSQFAQLVAQAAAPGGLGRQVFRRDRPFRRVGVAAGGLAHDQLDDQGDEDAGGADDHEGDAPTVGLGQPAARRGPDHAAQGNAEGIDRQGRRPLLRLVIVGDQRMGGGRQARLPDADPDPERQQLHEARRPAAEHGEAGPDDHGQGDDRDPVPAFGQPGDGQAQHGVEHGEGEAAEETELGVGELKVDLDGLADGGDDGAVDEVEGVGQHEQAEHQPRVAARIARFRRRFAHTLNLPQARLFCSLPPSSQSRG